MKIAKITNVYNPKYQTDTKANENQLNKNIYVASKNFNYEYIKANRLPITFKGNAAEIKNAYIITAYGDNIILNKNTKNNSYLLDEETQTELIYGKDAIKYLKDKTHFENDTQIIFPKKSEGTVIIDGEEISATENTAILINENSDVKINVKKGYPAVVTTKNDFYWYEKYGNNSSEFTIKKKFEELMECNSRLYNGEFTPNLFLPDKYTNDNFLSLKNISKKEAGNNLLNILLGKRYLLSEQDICEITNIKYMIDKLMGNGILTIQNNGYVKFSADILFKKEYFEQYLKEKDFTEEEIKIISPIQEMMRQLRLDSKLVQRMSADNIPQSYIKRLERNGVIYRNKKNPQKYIYWKKCYKSAMEFRQELGMNGFTSDEQDIILKNWQKENKIGYDLSGLKFLNDNIAIYNLNDKVNNWTVERTNWLTQSTSPSNIEGKTPTIGVSIVQRDKEGPIEMTKIRKGEKLHTHPNNYNKKQTEIYVVTSGAAALNIVKNNKSYINIIKEGEMAIVDSGVAHCVNSVLGEYEHIVVQVPSAFQYGFDFKIPASLPYDYNDKELVKRAYEELTKIGK